MLLKPPTWLIIAKSAGALNEKSSFAYAEPIRIKKSSLKNVLIMGFNTTLQEQTTMMTMWLQFCYFEKLTLQWSVVHSLLQRKDGANCYPLIFSGG